MKVESQLLCECIIVAADVFLSFISELEKDLRIQDIFHADVTSQVNHFKLGESNLKIIAHDGQGVKKWISSIDSSGKEEGHVVNAELAALMLLKMETRLKTRTPQMLLKIY